MSLDLIWPAILIATFLAVMIWAWRGLDAGRPSATHHSGPPVEPCWTEQISTDGRLSYGRSACFHGELAEMEARARKGEFDTPV